MNLKKTILVTTAALLSSFALTSCTTGTAPNDNTKGDSVAQMKDLKPTEPLVVKGFNEIPENWKYQGEGQKLNPVSKSGNCSVEAQSIDNVFAGLSQGDTFSTHHAFTNFVADDSKMSNVALGKLTVKDTNLGEMDFVTYEFSSTRDFRKVDTTTEKISTETKEVKNFIAVRGFDTGIENKEVSAGRVSPSLVLIGRCSEDNEFDRDSMQKIMESASINYVSKDNNE